MLWTTNGFPRIPNGIVTFDATGQTRIREASKTFPDAASVAALRAEGIKSVVVLPDWLKDTPWEPVTRAAAAGGLGITYERQVDGTILFRLN